MAVDANSTIISVVGGGTVDKKDIAVMAANGGIAVYETDKNIYVNAVKEEFINQRVINEYGGPVTQILQNVTPYAPGGTAVGQIQFLNATGNSKKFDAVSELKFDPANYKLSVFGDIESTYGNIVVVNGNVNMSSGKLSSGSIDVTGESYLVDLTVTGTANFDNTVNIGNLTANRDLTVTGDIASHNVTVSETLVVTGNANAGNINGGNLVAANYFTGTLTTNAQPNVTSVSTTLTVGNIDILGNTVTPTIQAAVDLPLSLKTHTAALATYELNLSTSGVFKLPVSTDAISNGNAILSETAGNGVTINTSGAQYHFNGTGNLTVPTLIATSINGTLAANSNAQPNVTSLGNLTGLQVGKTGANANVDVIGNVAITYTLVAANIGNSSTYGNVSADYANFANANINANLNVTNQINTSELVASGNVTIGGNLFVNGNTFNVNVETLTVEDPIISLGGAANGAASTTDGDRGLFLQTNTSNKFIGWDDSNGSFIVASASTLDANSQLATMTLGKLTASEFIGNFSGNSSANIISGNSSVNVAANGNVTLTSSTDGTLANTATLVFTSTGANVTGTLNVSNTSTLSNVTANIITANGFTGNLVSGTSQIHVANAGNITLTSASSNTLIITDTGANITGTASISGNVSAPNFVGTLASGNSNIAITANGNITMHSGGNLMANVSNTVFAVNGNLTAGNIDVTGNISADNFNGALANGTSSVAITSTNGDIEFTNNGTVIASVFNDRLEVTGNLNVTDTMTTGNFTVSGEFALGNGTTGNLNSNATTFNLVNANATTVNFAGAATAINIGATTGTLTISNPTVVGQATTQDLFNTVATTLNIGGAANTLSIGSATSTTTIGGDLAVIGGDITTNATTFTVANANATTLNIGGAATALNMGATTGTMTISNPTVVGANTTQNLFNTIATDINFGGAANIKLSTSGKTTNVAGNLNIVGTTTISDDGNLFIKGGTANGQFLKVTDYSNGNSIWANVSWSDLATSDGTRGPSNIALGQGADAATDVVAIGVNAGTGGGGTVLIGKNAGANALPSGSVEINGKGTAVTPNSGIATAGLYITPIRSISNAEAGTATYQASLRYDTTTNEVVLTTAGAATAATAGTVTTAAQGNITSLGTLTGLGVSGTITAVDITANTGVFTGDGSGLSSLNGANVSNLTEVPFASVANSVAGGNVSGQVTFAGTANSVAAGNISGTTLAAGVTGSSLTSVGTLTSLGVSGTITAANITANTGVFTGNGAGLSSVNIANVANALVFSAGTNNGQAVDAANVGTIDITINGTTYTLYAVPKV